jgi:hypothetical protein
MQPLGPFEVAPAIIVNLEIANFTFAINSLLRSEVAGFPPSDVTLQIDDRTTVKDGGVDAYVVLPAASGRLPAGASAWQFKAGKLGPRSARRSLRRRRGRMS